MLLRDCAVPELLRVKHRTSRRADQFDIHGTYVREHTRKEGLGAPIVAIGREMNQDAKTTFSLPRIYYGVTAIIRFDGRHAIFDFEDPLIAFAFDLDQP